MDMLGFLKVRAWDARQKHKRLKTVTNRMYIDEVWPMEGE